MPFTLQISFEGLIFYTVPGDTYPLEVPAALNQNNSAALLLNRTAADNPAHIHRPVALFRLENLNVGELQNVGAGNRGNGRFPHSIVSLPEYSQKGVLYEFGAGGTPILEFANAGPLSVRSSFAHLPDIQTFDPEAGAPRNRQERADDNSVIGEIHFSSGSLRADDNSYLAPVLPVDLAAGDSFVVDPYVDHTNQELRWPRQVPNRILLTDRVPGNSLSVRDNEGTWLFDLRPVNDQPVRISVSNFPAIVHNNEGPRVDHFSAFYDLFTGGQGRDLATDNGQNAPVGAACPGGRQGGGGGG